MLGGWPGSLFPAGRCQGDPQAEPRAQRAPCPPSSSRPTLCAHPHEPPPLSPLTRGQPPWARRGPVLDPPWDSSRSDPTVGGDRERGRMGGLLTDPPARRRGWGANPGNPRRDGTGRCGGQWRGAGGRRDRPRPQVPKAGRASPLPVPLPSRRRCSRCRSRPIGAVPLRRSRSRPIGAGPSVPVTVPPRQCRSRC